MILFTMLAIATIGAQYIDNMFLTICCIVGFLSAHFID